MKCFKDILWNIQYKKCACAHSYNWVRNESFVLKATDKVYERSCLFKLFSTAFPVKPHCETDSKNE